MTKKVENTEKKTTEKSATAKKTTATKKAEVKKTAKAETKKTAKAETKKTATPKAEVKKSAAPKAETKEKKTTKAAAPKAETKKSSKKTIDSRIRAIAESGKGIGMPNWFNLPKNKEMRVLHIDICKKLAELSTKHNNYPITYLVYFAVGKNAHRLPTFLGGYDKINEKKAETIFSWLKLFAKYHKNEKLFKNPNVAHALCRFYDKFSTKTKDFKAAMESMESNPKIDVKNAKAIVDGLGIAKQTAETELAAAEAAMEPAMVTA